MASGSVQVDEKLLRAVYSSYPAPLADPFVRLASEVGRLHPDWHTAFTRWVDCFEISVKFMGLAATAAYVRRAFAWKLCPRSKEAESCILRLRQNEKPSTGQWWELFRHTLDALQEGDECASLVAQAYYRAPGARALRKSLDAVTNVRNEVKAHGKTLEPAAYKEVLARHYEGLERWYAALGFFDRHWLVMPVGCEAAGGSYRVEVELRCGNHRCYPRRCFESSVELQPGRLYLMEDPGEGGIQESRAPLLIHPFAILDPEAAGDDSREVLVFEAFTDKAMKYDCPRTGQPVWAANLQGDFMAALGPVLSSHGLFARMSKQAYDFIKPFSESLRRRSHDFLERLDKQGVYRSNLQVPREDLEKRVAEFLESDKAALIITGPSGIGKTCFLCRFAEKWLAVEDSSTLILMLGADSLPQSDISLEGALRDALKFEGPVRDWVREVRKRLRKQIDAWRLVVLVDGVDKHPSIGNMLRAIDQWVRTVVKEEMPELKLIASCSPTGLDRAQEEISKLAFECYYAPVREILAGDSGAARLPAIQMSPFTEEERRAAYEKYQEAGFRPLTPYNELRPGALRALAHPLFMRLVTEAYKNDKVPPNPISFQTFQKYCEPYIFGDRGRKAFVDNLVDTMLDLKVRELSGQQMGAEPRLQEAYLAKRSAFHELLDDQVLSAHRRLKMRFPVPVEEEYVEFSMDRVFQFLLILRLFERHGGGPEQFFGAGLAKAVETARDFPSLRSGLVDLLAEMARNDQAARDRKEMVFACLCGMARGGSDQWMTELLSAVLVALADEAGDREAAGEVAGAAHDPFRMVTGLVLENLGESAMPLFFATVEDLFRRALWSTAIVLLRRLSESGGLTALQRFSLQNRLVVVLKNQDQWDTAREYSDRNDAMLPKIEDPQLRARHWLNRFSVLYDLGDRAQALKLCEQANRIARENGLRLEEAATANNLGIAYVYFDRPGDAEAILSAGIAAAGESDIVAGHNYLDRGLVRMVQWQLQAGAKLPQAEEDIGKASQLFKKMEYAQGILYGHASKGLIRLYEALTLKASLEKSEDRRLKDACLDKFREARELMERGLEMAQQLGEDWPNYGIQADLALWHLWHLAPNPEKALVFAMGAYELVVGNGGFRKDPEGTSIIAMILARVLLEFKKDAGALDPQLLAKLAPRPATVRKVARGRRLGFIVWMLLAAAERKLTSLAFHSAAARAAAGLIEAAPLLGKDPARYRKRREAHRAHLAASEYPPDFAERFEPMDWKLLFLAELF